MCAVGGGMNSTECSCLICCVHGNNVIFYEMDGLCSMNNTK